MSERFFPLLKTSRFESVSELMEAASLELTRLEGCSFPSRPEPKSATWTTPNGGAAARYRYEPDIELRWLVLDDRSVIDEVGPVLRASELFDDWATLGELLESNRWPDVLRAAAAFRAAAEFREPTVDGELRLKESLDGGIYTRRAAASQLVAVVTGGSKMAIEEALQETSDVETKFDLRRCLERLERAWFSER